MRITELEIPNSFVIEPEPITDRRGVFMETFRATALSAALGYPFVAAQGNLTVSRRDTIRGIHGTTIPPGQDKMVTCVRGAALDVVIDLRVGSPTFGMFDMVELSEESGRSLYIADGLGHAYRALSDDTAISYVCSAEYVPGTMIDINALDPDIGIPWRLDGPAIRSDKDAAAPGLRAAQAQGLLPTYAQCQDHYAKRLAALALDAG